jgi:structural maintenance of chromosome 1
LKEDYEKLKEEAERAAEASTFTYHKQRGIRAEIKQYEEQEAEAERYKQTVQDRVPPKPHQKLTLQDEAIIKHILWKLYQLDSSIETHRDALGAATRQSDRLKKDLETADAKYEHGKKDLASVQRDLLKDERALKRKEHAIEDKKPSLVSIDEKIAHTDRSLHALRTRREAVETDKKETEKTVKALERDLETVKKAAAKFEEDQKRLAQQKGVALSDADQAAYRKLKEESIKAGASEKSKLEAVSRALRAEKEVRDDLKAKEEQAEMQKKSVSEEIRVLKEKKDSMTSKVNTSTQEVATKKKELEGVKSERTRREIKKTELNEKLQRCLTQIQQMNYDLRESERERQQRETLATLKRVFPHVRGRVVDLCKPTQNRYALAVETILGRHINSIVVDTEKCATECINYLSSARLPVRTFIPLDTIMTKPVNANLRSIHRNAKLGIDVVNYERTFERGMAYVFGDAVVCDDYNTAREITVSRGHEVKCVTLDGTVINKNATITGGQSKSHRTGKNWDQQEAESLAKVRDDFIAQLDALGQDPIGREEDLRSSLELSEASLKEQSEQLVPPTQTLWLTTDCGATHVEGQGRRIQTPRKGIKRPQTTTQKTRIRNRKTRQRRIRLGRRMA